MKRNANGYPAFWLGSVFFATATLLGTMLPAYAQEKARVQSLLGQEQHEQFIVKYRDGVVASRGQYSVDSSVKDVATRLRGTLGSTFTLQRARTTADPVQVLRSSKKLDRIEAALLIRQLALDPSVEYVEPDREAHALAIPNDASYALQWYLSEPAGGISAPLAWDRSTSGPNVIVAIIDSGIASHSDLNTKKIGGYDFITDTIVAKDGDGRDADPADPGTFKPTPPGYTCIGDFECNALSPSDWHGTLVAGIAAATTNNAAGISGVGYNARFVPIRVLGRGGSGSLSDIADAIKWAAGGAVTGVPVNPYPARIINLSLGWETFDACSPTLQSAIDFANTNGAVVIAAAGNSNTLSLYQPAKCANVISVAATVRSGNRATYSSYASWITLAAPGGEYGADGIYSASNTGLQGPSTETYAYASGTSMSAPQVAGVVALMETEAARLCSRAWTPAEIKAKLISTARPFPSTQSQPIGAGILDASAAVFAAGCHVTGGNNPPRPLP